MDTTAACPDCLRRAWLMALLAPYVERSPFAEPRHRLLHLLSHRNEDLVMAVAPKVGDQLLARIDAITEASMRGELAETNCSALPPHRPLPTRTARPAVAPWCLIGRGDASVLDGRAASAVAIAGARRAASGPARRRPQSRKCDQHSRSLPPA